MAQKAQAYDDVQKDVNWRARIAKEEMYQFGTQQKRLYPLVETEEGHWRPQKKMFPDKSQLELPTYPREKRSTRPNLDFYE